MRLATDSTQAEIVAALREVGASVIHIQRASIQGCPDLLVFWGGQLHLLECKVGKRGLRDSQVRFHLFWKGPIHTVRTPDEALRAIGARG